MNNCDQAPLRALVSELQADYPGWNFAIRHHLNGSRLEACRTQATSGLYAVITADLDELRRELENAATSRADRAREGTL
jgi:hypothetical protein